MIAALEEAGWSLSRGPGDAEVIIVNTCGFISQAKKESIETGLELKARHPGAKVVMVGCLTERYGGDLGRQLPEIDGILGNRDPAAIVALLDGVSPPGETPPPPRPRERRHLLSFPGSAYVKIAEGCANRCTYCAIPLIRGDLASRPAEEIVAEAEGLLARGTRELVLIAQDLGSYGTDGGGARGSGPRLPRLLARLSGLKGEFWVRLLYIHPDHFPEEILDVMADDPRLLPYFDIPFQHASPRLLAAMGRRGDPERNLALVSRIRAQLPGAVVRSTFLLGFPGETDADFQRLCDFQGAARLDWLGAFTYSREEDTPAYRMPGRVPAVVAGRRKAEVERRQVPLTERALDGHVGTTREVLMEERIEGEEMSLGRAYLQAPDVDGLVVVQRSLPPGTVARVRFTRRNGFDLEGEPVQAPPRDAAGSGQR